MRILGFSKKWGKLQQPEFTTFRFPRKDKDWQVNEVIQIVFKPRSRERELMGVVEIIGKEPRFIFEQGRHPLSVVTKAEAIEDGFMGWGDMAIWLVKAHGYERVWNEPMNKLTLRWMDEKD